VFPEQVQRYAKGLYPLALLLVLVPTVDLVLRTFPPQFGTLQWRFAMVGLFIGNFGTILLGLGLIGLVAAISEQRGLLRGLGYATLVLAVITLAVLALFALDAIQIRRLANANYKRPILMSAIGALFTGSMGATTLALMGRAALLASRVVARPAAKARPAARAASPIVVSRQSTPELAAGTNASESV
jgi:hypothetical protein